MLYARLAGRARWFKRIWKEPLDHADATRLRTEQLSAVLRYTPVMMMANACNALVLMVAFWELLAKLRSSSGGLRCSR